EAVRLGEHDIAGDQHQDSAHEQKPRLDPVAERSSRVGEHDISEVEYRERYRRHGFRKANVDAFQDQEGFRKPREGEQETDLEQPLRFLVELAKAMEEGRLLDRREMLLRPPENEPGKQERQRSRDDRNPEHASN